MSERPSSWPGTSINRYVSVETATVRAVQIATNAANWMFGAECREQGHVSHESPLHQVEHGEVTDVGGRS